MSTTPPTSDRDPEGPCGPGHPGDSAPSGGEPGSGGDPELTAADAVDVYWRPGCGYCSRLLRIFEESKVTVRLHNIWEDGGARRFVQDHNYGDETVPTVALGSQVLTNPPPRPFVEALRLKHPDLVGAEPKPRAGLYERLRRSS